MRYKLEVILTFGSTYLQHYSAYLGANIYNLTGLLKNILRLPKITLDKKLNVIEFRRKKMEPLVLFLIKEISSFYTRSSILYFITTVYFHFTSILPSFCLSIYFHCLVCLILKFFLVRAIDVSLIIIIKITISNY